MLSTNLRVDSGENADGHRLALCAIESMNPELTIPSMPEARASPATSASRTSEDPSAGSHKSSKASVCKASPASTATASSHLRCTVG